MMSKYAGRPRCARRAIPEMTTPKEDLKIWDGVVKYMDRLRSKMRWSDCIYDRQSWGRKTCGKLQQFADLKPRNNPDLRAMQEMFSRPAAKGYCWTCRDWVESLTKLTDKIISIHNTVHTLSKETRGALCTARSRSCSPRSSVGFLVRISAGHKVSPATSVWSARFRVQNRYYIDRLAVVDVMRRSEKEVLMDRANC